MSNDIVKLIASYNIHDPQIFFHTFSNLNKIEVEIIKFKNNIVNRIAEYHSTYERLLLLSKDYILVPESCSNMLNDKSKKYMIQREDSLKYNNRQYVLVVNEILQALIEYATEFGISVNMLFKNKTDKEITMVFDWSTWKDKKNE